MLSSDKGADRVDVEIFVEVGELERERIIGRVGGHCTAFTGSTKKPQTRFRAALHTVVNNNAWDTQLFLDLRKCIGSGAGIGEVSRDVDLVGSAVGLGRFPRGQSNAVAFRCKGIGYTRADSGAGAENENDGGWGRHGAS